MTIEKAQRLIKMHVVSYYNVTEDFDVNVVWQCHAMHIHKFILDTSLSDGRYYELTFDEDTKKGTIDIFKKEDRIEILSYK